MDRFGQTCCRSILRRLVILLLLMLLGVQILLGQRMEWSIAPALPREGEPFTLSARFPLIQRENLGNPLEVIPQNEDFFPPTLQLFKGPIVQTRKERVDGRLSEFLVVSYIFIAQRAGRFSLDSLWIRIGLQDYRIAPILVEVVQKAPPHRVPFELEWIHPEGPFYVGQAIPLKLVAKDLRPLKEPELVQVEPVQGGILEKVLEIGGEEPVRKKVPENEHVVWIHRTLGQYLYTPYREGSQLLPSVIVRIEGMEQKLEGKMITILPLPNEVRRGSGAVGTFSIQTSLDSQTLPKGATAILRIRIEGKGNLHWIKAPSMHIEGTTLIHEGRSHHYLPTWEGYEGWVEEVYRLVPERSGTLTIGMDPFVAWDPRQHRIQEHTLPPLTIEVQEPQKEAIQQVNSPKGVTLDLLPEDSQVSGWTTWLHFPGSYSLLLPVVLGLMGIRMGEKKYLPYLLGWGLCLGVWVQTFHRFHPTNPTGTAAIQEYNEGVRYGRKGQWGEALYHLRKAAYLSPDPIFRQSVQKVEEVYVPTFRAPLPHRMPDHWFLLGIGALHLAYIGYFVRKRIRGGAWIPGIGISILIISGVGLYRTLLDLRTPWGVVTTPNVVLRTIPSPSAQEGTPVTEGSSFYVGLEKGEYVYVFLEGVKGWVEKKNLRRE